MKDINAFREKVYNKYDISKPSDAEVSEFKFIRKPVAVNPEGGLELYDKLRGELKTINESIANGGSTTEPIEEELSEKDQLLQKSLVSEQADANQTSIPNEEIADSRMQILQQKKKEIEDALNKQYDNVLDQAPKLDVQEYER